MIDNKNKKKLSKLAMPAKRADDQEMLGMDLSDNDPDHDSMQPMNDDAGDADDMPGHEEEAPEGSPEDEKQDQAELEHLSDDELLAEIKKRGLMNKMGKDQSSALGAQQEPNEDDQDLYS